jgi:peptide/nickel transport system permease protein
MSALSAETHANAPDPATKRRRARIPWSLRIGGALLAVIILVAIFAPLIAPYGPQTVHRGLSLAPPQAQFLLGTDSIGRDVLSRVIWASRTSLLIVFPSVALAVLLGLTLGVTAGYVGGKTDTIIMRCLDIAFAFPVILLAIAIVSVMGPNLPTLVLTIGVIYSPLLARVARAPILVLREQEFVQAAQSLGAPPLHIITRHILPNAMAPIIIEGSLNLSRALITESALAFLGLGVAPPTATWGGMMSQNRQFMELAPWAVMGPGLGIILASAAFILIGTGLREWLDPHWR